MAVHPPARAYHHRRPRHHMFKLSILAVFLFGIVLFNTDKLLVAESPSAAFRSLLSDATPEQKKAACEVDGDDVDGPREYEYSACDYFEYCEHESESEIDYMKLLFCDCASYMWLLIIVLVGWLLCLFYLLGNTADDYFCPALTTLADLLRMSPSLAGVTLLALGNGAPDVFSSIAAFNEGGEAALGFASALGGGVFITTFVLGFVAFNSKNAQINRRPFFRDVIAYIIAVVLLGYFFIDGSIEFYESCLFVAYYCCYVIFVIVSRAVFQHLKKKKKAANPDAIPDTELLADMTDEHPEIPVIEKDSLSYVATADLMLRKASMDSVGRPRGLSRDRGISGQSSESGAPYQRLDRSSLPRIDSERIIKPSLSDHIAGLCNNLVEDFAELGVVGKITYTLTAPFVFVRNLTIPKSEKDDWHWLFAVLNPFFGSGLFLYAIGYASVYWALGATLGAGFLLSVFVFFTAKYNEAPFYHPVLVLVAFVMSVIWIMKVANELIGVLQAFGYLMSIPSTILGLTVLAWGNCVGDLIADVAIARAGEPAMAVAGVFAGPMFNLLIGLGGALAIFTVKKPFDMSMMGSHTDVVAGFGFLFFSLCSSLVILPLCKFRLKKAFGAYLLLVYFVFLPVNITTVLKGPEMRQFLHDAWSSFKGIF